MARMHYAASLAYGMVAANHGVRADILYASPDRGSLTGLRRLKRQEAQHLFGRRAVEEARRHGRVQTHICADGPCRGR